MKSFATTLSDEFRRLVVMGDYAAWALLDPSKFTTVDKKKIKKVLIIHLGAMGELIILTPLLPAIKKQLNAEVSFMVSPGKEDVLKDNPYIDKIMTYKGSFRENLKQIKQENADLAIIMWPCFPSISLMCLLSGIKYKIGCFKNIKDGINFFLTRRAIDLRGKHAVECNLDIIKTIGLDNKNPKLEFYLSKKDVEEGKRVLTKLGLKEYAIIHPGFSFSSETKYPSRWWPPERYAEVADALIDKHKLKIVLTGNDNEKAFSEEIRAKMKNKKDVIVSNGKLTLRELAYLISKTKLLVSSGTGVLHLAAAFDRKTVALMGKENPVEWHPWTDEKNYKVMFHPEVCTQCDKNYCRKKTQECMLAITSKEVIKAAGELVK